jgi:hypothetical protein
MTDENKFFNAACLIALSFAPSMWAMDMNQDDDTRESLGIKGTMKGEHQLSNMREHLTAFGCHLTRLYFSFSNELFRLYMTCYQG